MVTEAQSSSATNDTAKRAAITIGAIVVYFLAAMVPLPGIDTDAWSILAGSQQGQGAMERISVVALGVVPLLTALMVVEAAKILWPSIIAAGQKDWRSARRLQAVTVSIALFVALVQATKSTAAMEQVTNLVLEPGWTFRLTAIATMIAGTAFLMWLSSVVSSQGITNGFWLIYIVPTLLALPAFAVVAFDQQTFSSVSQLQQFAAVVFVLGSIAGVVKVLSADPPMAEHGALIWPAFLTVSLLTWMIIPLYYVVGLETLQKIYDMTEPGQPLRIVLFVTLIPGILFARHAAYKQANAKNYVPVDGKPIVPAIVVTGIMVASDLMRAYSALPLPVDGLTLIIITSVAMSILSALRPR